jgi:hypothetical protein
MKLIARIDMDCRCMNRYFLKLFELAQEAQAQDEAAPVEIQECDADESQSTYHRFSHLIKPDMLMNVYSLVDFWLNTICEYHRSEKNLSLERKSMKGDNELQKSHKYLTECAGLSLSTVQASYERLDELRKVRNRFMHGGGHVPSNEEAEFSGIVGIVLSGSLIAIEDSFIWSSLGHAKKYLQAAVPA